MNREQAEALARFLHLCRPEWDARGIVHALGEAKTADPLNAALAAVRWTANPELRTPGGMGKQGEHWTERVVTGTPRPLRPAEACRNCGQAKHPPHAECDARVPVRTADVSEPVARLRALRDEATDDCCSHGVKTVNCLEHRAATTEPPADVPMRAQSNEPEGASE